MALTKVDARSLIREVMDDAASKLWSNTLLDRLATITLDSRWGELLEFAPQLTSQLNTITTLTAPGFIDLNLTGDGGDLTQRFFRVQHVVRDGQEYTAADTKRIVIEVNEVIANDTGKKFVYFIRGDQLWLLPLDTTLDVELRYTFTPARFSDIAESDNVAWPEGYEDAYVFEVAGRAMLKGGREDAAARLSSGRDSFANLRSALTRPHGGVIMPYQHMSAMAWGGE